MTTLNWLTSSRPPPNTTKWTSICCGNNKFVAVGRNQGNAVYSTDGGVIWHLGTNVDTTCNWQSVCFDGFSLFVAVAGTSSTEQTTPSSAASCARSANSHTRFSTDS